MKKILLATTVLAMTAPVVAAEGLSLSGYGRFGVDYASKVPAGTAKSQINMRMRVNIDGSMETDGGVGFGGRIRLQYSSGNTEAKLSPAMLYVTYSGLRVEVGNSNTAFDSAALMYNSEIGYLDRGYGDPIGNFYGFSSGPYAAAEANRMGVFASYSISGVNLRASYVNPNQTLSTLPAGVGSESSISADYSTGQFTVSAAYVNNAGSVRGDKVYFVGAEYAVNDMANVGLLYFKQNDAGIVPDVNRTTLYGNYKMDATTLKGYVAHDNNVANLTKTSFGIGADYDLGGGARFSGDIHRNYGKQTVAGLGVRFDF